MSVQDEQRALEQYLINNPSDSFAMNIYVDRLELQEFSVEQIQEHIENLNKERNDMQIQKTRTKEESIKDEVGNEFKLEGYEQQNEEQRVTITWQNRFQSWDMESLVLPNSAKRKEETVKVIQDIERQKDDKNKEQDNNINK